MPLDPVLISDTQGWLARARDDLRGAEVDLAAEPPLVGDALFHCQQAVEKSLKALLTFYNQPFRRTHNLEEIGEACLVIDSSLRPTVDEAVPLSEYAWTFRYPGPQPEPSLTEAEEALQVAARAFRAVLERLPPEVRL